MRGRDREAQRKREFEELTAPLLGALYRFAGIPGRLTLLSMMLVLLLTPPLPS